MWPWRSRWSWRLGKDFAIDVTFLRRVRELRDVIDFVDLWSSLDLYPGDHNPHWEFGLGLLNVDLLLVEVYNVHHLPDPEPPGSLRGGTRHMIDREGDLWETREDEDAAVVITTNGSVRRDGCAVMGRGCAFEAKQQYPKLEAVLGESLRREGNHVVVLRDTVLDGSPTILSFPVKHLWMRQADPGLIGRSVLELVNLCDSLGIGKVAMPRPGCGYGRLRWRDVKPLLECLDDRFIVVHRPGEV